MSSSHQRTYNRVLPTRYDGVLYRSRQEARYALFFSKLGLPFRYETEGWRVKGGTCYLPDFYFPTQEDEVERTKKGMRECYLEIKPNEPTLEEALKAEWLAQASGIPVYVFYGSLRPPGEPDHMRGQLFRVRQARLECIDGVQSDHSSRPISLPLTNELRVSLLQLYEAGWLFLVSYMPFSHEGGTSPVTLHLVPRQTHSNNVSFHWASRQAYPAPFTPDQMARHLASFLKHEQHTLLEIVAETIKQFLRYPNPSKYRTACARNLDGTHNYLICSLLEGDTNPFYDKRTNSCLYKECVFVNRLHHSLKADIEREQPLTFVLTFDESRQDPDEHIWVHCKDCGAIGISPGGITHDMFCGVHCQDDERGIVGVSYESKEAFQEACRQVEVATSQKLREAYEAARDERFEIRRSSRL